MGGFLGSIVRYLLFMSINRIGYINFPLGTICVNILGCFAIGYCSAHLTHAKESIINDFLVIGLLGGFTTFSAFGIETYNLIKDNFIGLALLYIFASILCSLFAIYIGNKMYIAS